MGRGDYVVDVLSGSVGQIVERYHPNYHPHYADFRIRFIGDRYRVVRQRHLRSPLLGERISYDRWNRSGLFAGRSVLTQGE